MEVLFGIVVVMFIGHIVLSIILFTSLMNERKDLLNRLMATSYKEYAVFEHNKEVVKADTKIKLETVANNLVENDVIPI